MQPWCVAWIPDDKRHNFDSGDIEWCACRTQPTKNPKEYRDTLRTKCGYVVMLTVGIEQRAPTL